MKLFTMMKEIARNTVCGPVTRNYPAVKRPPFPGERGKLVMEEGKCIFCGICAKKCPSHALTVTRKPEQSWKFERFRCILCGSCRSLPEEMSAPCLTARTGRQAGLTPEESVISGQ